jgi:hypothetical protein
VERSFKIRRSGVGAVRSAQIPLYRSTDFEPCALSSE